MLSENYKWNLIANYVHKKSLISHQIDTFNDYLNNGIQRVVEECNIDIDKKEYTYLVSFDEVFIPSPIIMEEDRTVRKLYPSEARRRDLTYDAPICVNIKERYQVPG